MQPPVLLPIVIDSTAPITINAQITQQIKLLIALGELKPGEALPTVTQLAKHTSVNHNTIAAVYNDLIEAGYLVAQRGKGTFVAHTQAVQDLMNQKQFYSLLGRAFSAASTVGLGASEFGVAAYAQAVMLNRYQAEPLKLVFVESWQHNEDLHPAIQSELGIPLSFIPWEDLSKNQPQALRELLAADLVVTTMKYLWSVTEIVAPNQEVIAVDIQPDLQILTRISSLHRHARILLIGLEAVDSEQIKRVLEQSAISHVSFQSVGVEYLQQNTLNWEQFDLIVSTPVAIKCLRQYIPNLEKTVVFNFSIEPTNLLVLKARIAAIKLAHSSS